MRAGRSTSSTTGSACSKRCRCVDLVVPFDEDTPIDLIRRIRPDVYTKGGDYTIDRLPEAEVVERFGGVVQILPLVDDRSTSRIIERVLDVTSR